MIWPALYADIAYRTGWTIPHIREELDLPMLDALREHWAQFPPLPVLTAYRYGAAKPKGPAGQPESVEEQDYIPAKRVTAAEFDEVLRTYRLPTPDQAPQAQPPSP